MTNLPLPEQTPDADLEEQLIKSTELLKQADLENDELINRAFALMDRETSERC